MNHAIVMDFTKYMSRVIALNEEEGWARVEPGIVLDELNRIAAPFGLKYAPDPTTSNRACVGGGIGNNTCGSHSVVYGKTIDHIMELRTILSDGSQAHFRPLDQGGTGVQALRRQSGVKPVPGRAANRRRKTGTKFLPDTPKSCAGSADTTWMISSTLALR